MNRNLQGQAALVTVFLILACVSGTAVAATWTHSVLDGYDVWYLNGTSQKFRYNLANQQWGHYSTAGSSWYAISATGRPDTFIGSGAWYDLGNGFTYQYTAAYDWAAFKDGSAQRFLYKYAPGQWYHTADTLSWKVLGAAGLNGAFLGSGAWYDLGNGFTYQYTAAYDWATFKDGSAQRFLYKYVPGRWYHTADILSWKVLGTGGQSASFMGDGGYHDLLDGWNYFYRAAEDKGVWFGGYSAGDKHFAYRYDIGQWYDRYSLIVESLIPLGSAGVSSAFIGDGTLHNLNNGWSYAYIRSGNYGGFWKAPLAVRFTYDYTNHTWTHWDAVSYSVMPLDPDEWHSTSIWDGGRHWANGGMYLFQYDMSTDELRFYAEQIAMPTEPTPILKYSYGTHQWFDSRAVDWAGWCAITVYDGRGLQEIQKSYWAGGLYEWLPSGGPTTWQSRWLAINATYSNPIERLALDTGDPTVWSRYYNYATGNWHNGYPDGPVVYTGDPDYYRNQ